MTKNILNEELKLEELERIINKLRYKIKKITASINNDFINSFKQISEKMPSELLQTLSEFFGYHNTPFKALKVRNYIM
jgi:hypothetical protein